jgi:hypothetical protein
MNDPPPTTLSIDVAISFARPSLRSLSDTERSAIVSSPTLATLPRRSTLRLGVGSLAATLAFCGQLTAGSTASTSLGANKALVRRVFEEIVNDGNTAVIDELYAPVFVDLTRAAGRLPHPVDLPVPLADFHAVFPNIVASIEAMIAEGDLVATRITWRNEHPPAGTHIEGRTMHLSRVVNERIIEEWSAGWDWLDQSLVALSPPESATGELGPPALHAARPGLT